MNNLIESNIESNGYNEIANTKDYFEYVHFNKEYPVDFKFTKLSIIDNHLFNKGSLKIKADIIEEDVYPGFVTIFLYDDGKVLGHYEYVKESNLPKDVIAGNYFILDNALLLFLKWGSITKNINTLNVIPLNMQTLKRFYRQFLKYKIQIPS